MTADEKPPARISHRIFTTSYLEMRIEMIKLVASDLDGTLLLNGAQSVEDSMFETIGRLLDRGILFAPASGRQMTSLKRLFAPVAEELVYISENGALVSYKGKTIAKTPMKRELALEIIEDVLAQDYCEVLVSGEKTAYIKPKTKEYHDRMTKVVNYHTTLVSDFSEIQEDILKVAVCDLSGIEHSKEHFFKRWGNEAAAVVSGSLYLDFMDLKVSKGNAMKQIQQSMNILPEECMAFGDNYNDIPMLDSVGHAYVMEKAVDDIKKHGQFITANVEHTLKDVFHL